LKNTNFCGGYKESFSVFGQAGVTLLVLSGIVGVFLLFGTILITSIVTIIGYFIISAYGDTLNMKIETIGPILVIFIISFTIVELINSVFAVACDAMLHCYMIDSN